MNYTKIFFRLLKTYNINLYFSIREFICAHIYWYFIKDINSDPILQLIKTSYKVENYINCDNISKNYLSHSRWHPVLFYTNLYRTGTISYKMLLDLNRILWYNEDMYNLGLKYIE